jgi:D-alanyl-D-alanine endopeptidase (penicillin-binding protein 7)
MKRKLTALLLGVCLTVGMQGQASAAHAKKDAAHKKTARQAETGKHAKKQASAAHKQAARKSTSKHAATKPAGKHAAAPAPAKNLRSTAENSRNIHKVSMADSDPGRLALHSASALVLDLTNSQPIVEKNSREVVPIASISKLMTAMVVLDAHLDMNEVIAIGDEDVDGLKGTRSRLPVGTTMTRETAMLLALMSSENRAAHTLGRHYPGGLPAFVQAMNRKAQVLGMVNSRFEEPTGLSSNNVSTAQDLARMVTAAARYPEIRAFSTTAEARVELNGHIRDFNNTNALVRSDNWEIGLSKTGYISEAGRCLVMQARVAGRPVIIVLLDSNGKMTRVGDANRIKRWMESASLPNEHKRT